MFRLFNPQNIGNKIRIRIAKLRRLDLFEKEISRDGAPFVVAPFSKLALDEAVAHLANQFWRNRGNEVRLQDTWKDRA